MQQCQGRLHHEHPRPGASPAGAAVPRNESLFELLPHLWEGALIESSKIGEEKTMLTSEFISPLLGSLNGIKLDNRLDDATFGLEDDADIRGHLHDAPQGLDPVLVTAGWERAGGDEATEGACRRG